MPALPVKTLTPLLPIMSRLAPPSSMIQATPTPAIGLSVVQILALLRA